MEGSQVTSNAEHNCIFSVFMKYLAAVVSFEETDTRQTLCSLHGADCVYFPDSVQHLVRSVVAHMEILVEYLKSEEYHEGTGANMTKSIEDEFMDLVKVLAHDHICDKSLFHDRKAEDVVNDARHQYSSQEFGDAFDRLSKIFTISMLFDDKRAEVNLAAAQAQQLHDRVESSGTPLITPPKQRAGGASMAPVTPSKRALQNSSEMSASKRHKDGNTQNTPSRSVSRLARNYLRPADQHYAASPLAFKQKYRIDLAEFFRYKQSLRPDGELECSCGKRAVYYTVRSKESENYGRGYRGCHVAFPKPGNCGWFFWEDDVADFEAYDEGTEFQEIDETDEIRSVTVRAEDDGQSQAEI